MDLAVAELKDKSEEADTAAWAHAMPLWPEAEAGDVDPLMNMSYDIVMIRLGAEWLALNHPDEYVRSRILRAVLARDPYHETRGKPVRPLAEQSVKEWRPSDLRSRIDPTVDLLMEKYFEELRPLYPGSGSRPLPPETIERFRPCVLSFFVHWLFNNFPDTDAVDAASKAYLREDPLLMERCGAGDY